MHPIKSTPPTTRPPDPTMEEMLIIPRAEAPHLVSHYGQKLMENDRLKTAATLAAKKHRILYDPTLMANAKVAMLTPVNRRLRQSKKRLRQVSLGTAGPGEDDADSDNDMSTPAAEKIIPLGGRARPGHYSFSAYKTRRGASEALFFVDPRGMERSHVVALRSPSSSLPSPRPPPWLGTSYCSTQNQCVEYNRRKGMCPASSGLVLRSLGSPYHSGHSKLSGHGICTRSTRCLGSHSRGTQITAPMP